NGEKHKDKNGYSRNFYSLFQIARTTSENILAGAYQSVDAHWYMASGSQSFLNKLVAKIIEVENYHHFIYDFDKFKKEQDAKLQKTGGLAEQKNIAEKNYWVTTIGDFIFEAKIPKYIFEIIEKIYQDVNSLSEYDSNKINNLFFEPGKTELIISRSKKRADIIREEVKKLWSDSL
ncbi:MAG: hypothetical protein V1655_02030, partial [bacterium]